MFKSLKDKLKGWVSKTKDETEEEVVETEAKETKKEVKKATTKTQNKEKSKKEAKPKEKKKKEKKKEIKEKEVEKESKEQEDENLEKKPEETKEEPQKIEEQEPEEEKSKEEKKGFFGSFFSKKKEEVSEEEDSNEEEKDSDKKQEKEETKEEIKKEPEEEKEEPEKKKSGFSLFRRKTLSEEKFDELFDELELILLQNNVAYSAIEQIKENLKKELIGEDAKTDIETALRNAIESLLINPPNIIEQIKEKEEKPFVILFAGINGAGKTTTIAKVAHLLKKNNLSVCLASGDTFRAAAIEQLQVHADRLEVPLIKKDYGADPASVGFDAVKYAEKNKVDVVLIDTAGRMNNRDSLMREIEKIARVNKPDLKIFLGESITGNDATEQAKDFNDSIQIDGIILSKADVDEKGGTAISVSQVTGKPILYLGTGQTYDDLEVFDKEKLLDKIFS